MHKLLSGRDRSWEKTKVVKCDIDLSFSFFYPFILYFSFFFLKWWTQTNLHHICIIINNITVLVLIVVSWFILFFFAHYTHILKLKYWWNSKVFITGQILLFSWVHGEVKITSTGLTFGSDGVSTGWFRWFNRTMIRSTGLDMAGWYEGVESS